MTANEKNDEYQPDKNSDQQEEVDVDKMRIKVLILCQNRARLDNVASFLNRRGWESIVISKIEQAIKILASDRPDFVMISMNHVNKKVAVLPNFITQTFKTKCIVFGEQSDSKTIGIIHASKAEYKMMGMISGPSVHRKIKQILNDIYNKKPGNQNAFAKSSLDTSNVITIGDSNPKNSESSIQRFSQDSNVRSAVPQSAVEQVLARNSEYVESGSNYLDQAGFNSANLQGQSCEPSNSENTNGFKSKSVISNFSITNKATSSQDAPQQAEQYSDTPSFQSENNYTQTADEIGIKKNNLLQNGQFKHKPTLDIEKGEEKKKGEPMFSKGESNERGHILNKGDMGLAANAETQTEKNPEKGIDIFSEKSDNASNELSKSSTEEAPNLGFANGKSRELNTFANSGEKGKEINNSNSKGEISKKKRKKKNELGVKSSILKNESKEKKELYSAVSKTIGSLCEKPEEMIFPVDLVTTVFIIPVKGQKNTGFLLVGASEDIRNEEAFLNSFQKQFEHQLNLGEADYIVEKTVKCRIEEVSFYDFCKNKGDFTIVEISGDTEICVTFIPFGNPIPEIKQRLGHVKSEIDVSTLPVNKEFTFNTYLHLRKNQKYFLFMKKGNFFLENQKDRLLTKNVPLFISREDTDEYKYFYMRNHVQDFIESFISQNNIVAAA